MTPQEKAIEIYNRETDKGLHLGTHSLVEMAEWKDQQFKEYLERKKMEMLDKRRKGEGGVDTYYKRRMVEEIIDELFGEIEQDNSDREE